MNTSSLAIRESTSLDNIAAATVALRKLAVSLPTLPREEVVETNARLDMLRSYALAHSKFAEFAKEHMLAQFFLAHRAYVLGMKEEVGLKPSQITALNNVETWTGYPHFGTATPEVLAYTNKYLGEVFDAYLASPGQRPSYLWHVAVSVYRDRQLRKERDQLSYEKGREQARALLDGEKVGFSWKGEGRNIADEFAQTVTTLLEENENIDVKRVAETAATMIGYDVLYPSVEAGMVDEVRKLIRGKAWNADERLPWFLTTGEGGRVRADHATVADLKQHAEFVRLNVERVTTRYLQLLEVVEEYAAKSESVNEKLGDLL